VATLMMHAETISFCQPKGSNSIPLLENQEWESAQQHPTCNTVTEYNVISKQVDLFMNVGDR
jgi:hypothetical protein